MLFGVGLYAVGENAINRVEKEKGSERFMRSGGFAPRRCKENADDSDSTPRSVFSPDAAALDPAASRAALSSSARRSAHHAPLEICPLPQRIFQDAVLSTNLLGESSAMLVGTRLTNREQSMWILHSIILTTMLGYLHQGGLVPSLLRINQELRGGGATIFGKGAYRAKLDLVFWRTFMPPRHLFLPLGGTLLIYRDAEYC